MQASQRKCLPKDLMEVQLGEIDLLLAMYPTDEEIHVDNSSRHLLEELRIWCESEDTGGYSGLMQDAIHITLGLDFDVPVQADGERTITDATPRIELVISVPIAYTSDSTASDLLEPPKAAMRVQPTSWMSKAEAAQMSAETPQADIASAIECVREAAAQHFIRRHQKACTASPLIHQEITRIWFYFPSISTRSKRDDIVNYAPTYNLTGFLLAGKPGVLCLEGYSQAIDDFMKFIKTVSWNDIPSQHKKVSERHREEGPELARAFKDMSEITDDFGDTRRGTRGNRNDMSVLKSWMEERGVGQAFEKVFV